MKACEKPRSVMGRSMALAAFLLVAAAVATTAFADTIPFWGDAEPQTNRTCASGQTASLSYGFESRVCSSADFALQDFDSTPRGVILIVR